MTAALLTACSGVASPTPPGSVAASPVHWTYEGEAGPDRWADLSPDYTACEAGEAQSPIDVDAAPAELENPTFDYLVVPLEIVDNGHSVQVTYPAGSSITLDGTSWELLQFHFHAPSEHTIEGAAAAAELHLVHRAADGRLAVVGVLFEEGEANPAFRPVIDNLPAGEGPATKPPGVEVDAERLLPEARTTWRYPGSLTTPPCTEGVSWLLMTEPVALSGDQLDALTEVVDGNNRPTQPLNERDVVEDSTP
jgi:carbonic anhydrase